MKVNDRNRFIITVIATMLLLAVVTVYNFYSFYQNGVGTAQALGESALASETAQLEAYMTKGMDALKVTVISVEYMIRQGKTAKDIEKFLVEQSARYKQDIDENFTGIYGYVLGEYIDGIGWVPDADYVPQSREWYIAAVEGNGEAVIVSPYLDAQTHTIMISVSCLLSDKKSVISLDIELNEIQSITSEIGLNNMGYGFIVDKTGMVVAHHNSEKLGENFYENPEMAEILNNIKEGGSFFNVKIDGEDCMVFTDIVMDNMSVVLIIESSKLYGELRGVLIRNIIVFSAVIIIVIFFLSQAFRKIQMSIKSEEKAYQALEKQNEDVIKTIVRIIDAKDRYTNGHSQRVANYSREIAARMGKTAEEQQTIYYSGLMHDVGKIRVSDMVINKPGKLTEEEFVQIKTHTITGYYILKQIYKDSVILDSAKCHHERYDGGGYPVGLSGENIPEAARIVGVADAYDAMASDRSYRKALPQAVVRHEIEKGKGTQFDPKIAEIMLEMIDEDKNYTMRQAKPIHRTILVADRQSVTIRTAAEFLSENESYSVIGAQTLDDALRIISEIDIDLIMLDYKLTDEHIERVIELIRGKCDIPILLLTKDKSLNSEFISAELGVSDYITKPLSAYVLNEIVHGILG